MNLIKILINKPYTLMFSDFAVKGKENLFLIKNFIYFFYIRKYKANIYEYNKINYIFIILLIYNEISNFVNSF